MDFGLSGDQTLFQDSLRRLLADCAALERTRRFADDADDRGTDIRQQLAALGVCGITIDGEHGGSGLGALDAALAAQELGAQVAPAPFLATAVLAPLALRLAGSPAQQAAWLPRIASGETSFGAALAEHSGAREDAGIEVRAGRLHGRALFVVDFDADAYLVAARCGALFLVDAAASGLARQPLVTIDRTRRLGELRFDAVSAEALPGREGLSAVQVLLDHARVMLAADTLGAAQHMLDAAVAYAGEREQFGRVIGSFQAVKHLCAEMAAALEPCHAMLWYAAYALDALPEEARVMACQTKAHISEVGTFVAKTATEVHGGVGFTDLLGLHYWFKRIGLNRQLCGGPERLRDDAARAQGWRP